jgi:predicted transcriptional regulator of viral defense system
VTLTEAHAELLKLGVPAFSTNEAAACLRISNNHASQLLARLARTGHVARIDRGVWALPGQLGPALLPEALTAPKPAYVSLYTALYQHGMIEQIPEVIYAVTLAPTRRIETALGTVSLHHITPKLFFGFDVDLKTGAKLAQPEKALFDTLYLRPARSRLFRALPELELPERFDEQRVRATIDKIASQPRATLVRTELDRLLAARGPRHRSRQRARSTDAKQRARRGQKSS